MHDAVKSGTPFPAPQEGASGGMVVRNLGSRDTNYLEWRDVKVYEAGEYVVTIDYSSPDERAFDFAVDGGAPRRVNVKGTDGKFMRGVIFLELSDGVHTIRLSNGSARMPDIDRMTLDSGKGIVF